MGDVVRRARRNQGRRSRSVYVAAVVAAVGLLIASAAWFLCSRTIDPSYISGSSDYGWSSTGSAQSVEALAAQQALSTANTARRSVRVVYPYSIVPGGVRNARELQEATAHDPVAAHHYAGFDFSKARTIELQESRLVYLSYRLHDKVYWTHKKIALHKGEKLLTDGKTTARTRCANQVSDQAKNAVSPEEPPAEKFEDPYLADGGTAMQSPFPRDLNSAFGRHIDGLGSGAVGPPVGASNLYGGNGGQGFAPLFPPPLPAAACVPPLLEFGEKDTDDENKETKCPAGPPRPPGPPTPPVPGSGPPATVPEPGTVALVASGVALIISRQRRLRR